MPAPPRRALPRLRCRRSKRGGVLHRARAPSHAFLSPIATHHLPPSSSSRHSVAHGDSALARCSSPRPAACLPPSSLSTAPERRLLATAVPHQVGCGRRRCRVSSVFRCFISMFSSVSSRYCICCSGYICTLQVYVFSVSVVSYVCFKFFIRMLQ